MVSRIILGLMITVGLWGQTGQQPIVYQQVFTNLATQNTGSITVYNVGQTGHIFYLVFSNAPSKTCTTPNLGSGSGLQFSFDNSSFNVSTGSTFAPITNYGVTTNKYYQVSGGGAFPFVRAFVGTFDNTNCVANGWYTGTSLTTNTVFGQGINPMYGLVKNGTSNVETGWVASSNPVIMGGITSNGKVAPVTICNQTSVLTATAGTTVAILPSSLGTTHICRYAVTMTATGTFQLASYTVGGGTLGAACTTVDSAWVMTPVHNLNVGVPFIEGNNLGEMFLKPASEALCISPVTGNANISMTYGVW